MGLSGSEIFVILLAVLIFFGANKIPEFARGIGKGIREFKKAADDIKAEINNSTAGVNKEINEIKDDITKPGI